MPGKPSISKLVYITETGIQETRRFMENYGISSWENKKKVPQMDMQELKQLIWFPIP